MKKFKSQNVFDLITKYSSLLKAWNVELVIIPKGKDLYCPKAAYGHCVDLLAQAKKMAMASKEHTAWRLIGRIEGILLNERQISPSEIAISN